MALPVACWAAAGRFSSRRHTRPRRQSPQAPSPARPHSHSLRRREAATDMICISSRVVAERERERYECRKLALTRDSRTRRKEGGGRRGRRAVFQAYHLPARPRPAARPLRYCLRPRGCTTYSKSCHGPLSMLLHDMQMSTGD